MKAGRGVVAALALSWLLAVAYAGEPPAAEPPITIKFDPPETLSELTVTKTVLAALLPAAPTIDGRLDDKVWSRASELGPLARAGTGLPAPVATKVYAGHRDGILYLGVRCEEPEAARRAGPDEFIEVLLNGRNDRAGVWVVGLAASSELSVYRVAGPQRFTDWKPGCRAACAQDATGWTAEMAIPRKSLPALSKVEGSGVEATGAEGDAVLNDVIEFNVARRRPGSAGEPFTWNPSPAAFEDGRWLGILSFETSPCSIQKVEVGWPYAGRNRFRVSIRNHTAQEQKLVAVLATRRKDGNSDASRYRLTVPPAATVEYGLFHQIGAPGQCDMAFGLAAEKDGRLVAQFQRPGLDVSGSTLVIEDVRRDGDAAVMKFRILLPVQELSDASLNVSVREPGTFRTQAGASEKKLSSRTGEIRIAVPALPAGKWQVQAYLMREDYALGRAVQEFSTP